VGISIIIIITGPGSNSNNNALAQKDYLERHNSIAKVVHQALAK
jgi:hypothetical protein